MTTPTAHEPCDAGSALSALILCGRPIRRLGWEDGITLAPGTDAAISWYNADDDGVIIGEAPMSSLGRIDMVALDWIIL